MIYEEILLYHNEDFKKQYFKKLNDKISVYTQIQTNINALEVK